VHESEPTPSPFDTLHHLALVVESLDRAVQRLEALGFGPFVDYPPLEEYTRLNVPDSEAFHALRIKLCRLGPVSLQVIEGRPGTIYGEFLRARGEGVFHLGFVVDDIESARRDPRVERLPVSSSGRRADGSGFTYFDTASDLGVNLLLRQSPAGETK
jgi:catechol 2,3-dioxygenase-like lactoylglutathione lyase family enzyme